MQNLEKLAQGTNQEVIKIIEKHGWTVINSLDDINEIFEFESIKTEKHVITLDSNAIIIFDHPDYNVARLHEYFDTITDNRHNIETFLEFPQGIPDKYRAELIEKFQTKMDNISPTIKVFYCNNPALNETLFKPFFQNLFNHMTQSMESKQDFNYDCPPVILQINKEASIVCMEFEKLLPMNIQNAFSSYIIIHDGEYVKEDVRNRKEAAKEQQSMDKFGAQPIPEEPKFKA